MGILIKTVRVFGFRGLENIEIELEQTTILTGMNNSGKTSFLSALQLALGNRQLISPDDFFIKNLSASDKIIIDLLIVPTDEKHLACEEFSEDWEVLFTTDRIRNEGVGNSFVPLRTVISFDSISDNYKTQQYILKKWNPFVEEGVNWFDSENGNKTSFYFDEVPFFYMDAQRDILEDTKLKSSYLGKMLSKIKYSKSDIKAIEKQIKDLNDKAVGSSDILSSIESTLKDLDSAMDSGSEGIEITPFTKKIRDLSKGLTIYYSDRNDSFSMEYHGMGTRSWSSLLTLKAFISLLLENADKEKTVFFPILAIEEPEAHLHPNAQKQLYHQIDEIFGQKIISTHSPYVAASAQLGQIRNFYKDNIVTCRKIDIAKLNDEDIRKISRQVINTRGEIFFSKMIVLFEGETEEQSLPIFAQKYFDEKSHGMGLDFVGVGGHGSYLPFLRFSESLNIPWVIFSDAEEAPVNSVKSQFIKCRTSRKEEDSIVFLEEGKDFEKELIDNGFSDEIKNAIKSLDVYTNEEHRKAKQDSRNKEIQNYTPNEIYKIITGSKTQFGPAIAEEIIKSKKDLPPKVIILFEKITAALKAQEANV